MDDPSDKESPVCSACGKPMRRRTAGKGPRAGQAFWGCSGYPDCRETLEISDQSDSSDKSGPPKNQ
jgi:ssDNA-binding Zn-finger/Zn-ribbon topoisomerase 1